MDTPDIASFDDDNVRDIEHECAIFLALRRPDTGIQAESVLPYVIKGLKIQSNRGQEGFGLAALDDEVEKAFQVFHSEMSVNEMAKLTDEEQSELFAAFDKDTLIGHNRYATHGPQDIRYSQPMQNDREDDAEPISGKAIAFNGHIANSIELREKLEAEGKVFKGTSDTEVLLHLISRASLSVEDGDDINYRAIFSQVDSEIDGACSLAMIDGVGNALLYRHSNGIRPLELFETEDGVILGASETEAFAGLVGQHRSINAGEIFFYDRLQDCWSISRVGQAKLKYCVMELLYFSRANSQYQGVSHYRIRRDIGELMAEYIKPRFEGISAYEKSKIRVIPVPNTAIPYALGIATALDLPFEMGIERRENTRAFINGAKNSRWETLQRKFAILSEAVAGNIVVIVDDTLIRRDTSITVTNMLRKAGAERVEWLICAPPFKGTCYYGIAVPSVDELAYWNAAKRLPKKLLDQAVLGEEIVEIEAKIAKDIGTDKLNFLPYDLLLKTLPGDADKYCHGCFRGIYPTPMGTEKFENSRDDFLESALA